MNGLGHKVFPHLPPACPGRDAAFSRRYKVSSGTVHRRAGTHGTAFIGPGSAAHRHSASKTRVNALMALRYVRGTRTCFYRTNSFIAFSRPSIVIGYMRCEKRRRMMLVDSE